VASAKSSWYYHNHHHHYHHYHYHHYHYLYYQNHHYHHHYHHCHYHYHHYIVENGADAVYFGLQEGFNARARASNFNIDELTDVMNYLHDFGRKGYLVINVLVFDEELESLENLVRKIAKAGVDALICQDLGAVDMIRSIAPNLPIHGSTQMSITDHNGAQFVRNTLNIDRVVVGRELSIEEISKISSRVSNVEVEAFVHGALCVSYSGQVLTINIYIHK